MTVVVEREFDVRGRRIAARCWHDPALPPVLALHGWQDNAASFDRLAPLLAGYHVVAMDFAGHGFSDWRAPGTRYHTLDHVDDVLAVADALGWSRFRLVGHSMGAGIGVLFAGALPERIAQMVLIDGLGPYAGAPEEAPQILREAVLEWRGWEAPDERVMADVARAVDVRRRGFTPLGEAAARILCSRSLRAVEGGFTWTTDRRVRLHSSLRLSETQIAAFLARIDAPVLVIRAEGGFPAAWELFTERLRALPQAELVALPGGHHLHLDDAPEQVADAVVRFFSRRSA